MRNVVVLGGSYSGARAAELLSQTLPDTYRVILIDRQSHFNHLYMFPRVGVVPSHAHKVFIPYTGLLPHTSPITESTIYDERSATSSSSLFIKASVVETGHDYVDLDRDLEPEVFNTDAQNEPELGDEKFDEATKLPNTFDPRRRLKWDYLIYALGSTLPPPLLSPARTKDEGVAFLEAQQERIARSQSILIVGGGALGIQYATDIADLYNNPANAALRPLSGVGGSKKITLIHSRSRFLPLYKQDLHDEVVRRLEVLGVDVRLGERLNLPRNEDDVITQPRPMRQIQTSQGILEYDLLLKCTGQQPNSTLLGKLFPGAINFQGYVEVKPTLQLNDDSDECTSRIYVIGDVANTKAIRAGHVGWNQAGIVVQNIMSSILCEDVAGPSLIEYEPSPPQIKVTLGLRNSVSELLPSMEATETDVKIHEDGVVDSGWQHTWNRMRVDPMDPTI